MACLKRGGHVEKGSEEKEGLTEKNPFKNTYSRKRFWTIEGGKGKPLIIGEGGKTQASSARKFSFTRGAEGDQERNPYRTLRGRRREKAHQRKRGYSS